MNDFNECWQLELLLLWTNFGGANSEEQQKATISVCERVFFIFGISFNKIPVAIYIYLCSSDKNVSEKNTQNLSHISITNVQRVN